MRRRTTTGVLLTVTDRPGGSSDWRAVAMAAIGRAKIGLTRCLIRLADHIMDFPSLEVADRTTSLKRRHGTAKLQTVDPTNHRN